MVNSLYPWIKHPALNSNPAHLDAHHTNSLDHLISLSISVFPPSCAARMRLALYTIICCCIFTTVLPLVKGATEELNSSFKKRFKVWLKSRVKRDLHSSLVAARQQYSDIFVGPQQDENAKTVLLPASVWQNVRSRRSASSKLTGCNLGTCVFHDLIHDLYKYCNKQNDATAPPDKMGSNGYGRRRRSLLDVVQLAFQTGRQNKEHSACF